MNKKLAAFWAMLFPKNLIEIGEETYCVESSIENDGEDYVLLRNVDNSSDVQIRRVCEYYETVEDETELRNVLMRFEAQKQRAGSNSKCRWWAFDILVFALTIAAIIGKSWLVRHCETSILGHEFVCYGLLAISFCVINHRIPAKNSFATSFIITLGLAIVFTICVFLLNNWWRYLYENTVHYWGRAGGWYWSYRAVLRSDFRYSIGIGKFRYLIVFLFAILGLLADTAFVKWLKKHRKQLRNI